MNKIEEHSHKEMESPSHSYFDTYIKAAKGRVIFFSDVVTKKTAADLVAMLLYYDNISNEDIFLYINSPGGDASGLSCIYDIIQMIDSPVRTICMGRAYSAGAVLVAAGTKGKRYAFKNSEIMIHGIQCIFPLPGEDIANSKNYFTFLKDNDDKVMKILAKHTGHPLSKLKKDCEQDLWMTAQEALKYGIIDDILG
jgi:ATP-dependent Clp protease protease subunit